MLGLACQQGLLCELQLPLEFILVLTLLLDFAAGLVDVRPILQLDLVQVCGQSSELFLGYLGPMGLR